MKRHLNKLFYHLSEKVIIQGKSALQVQVHSEHKFHKN